MQFSALSGDHLVDYPPGYLSRFVHYLPKYPLNVETEFFRQGHWDREGVKGYLALPCFNRANDMITVELTESQTVVKSTIGKATELLRYDGTDGYTTGTIGKIMGGGGTQISPNAKKLALLSGK